MVLSSRCSILRYAGHVVTPLSSIAEAIELFRKADFDLVLLCHSVPVEDRDILTSAIRALDPNIPIYTVAALSRETPAGFADGLLSCSPRNLIGEIGQAVRKATPRLNSV
jgi:CheY-like chemotaxis protein